MAEFCMTACFIDSLLHTVTSWAWQFFNTDISQGSVVTQLRCGGIVNEDFVANLLVNLTVKEFWKSVNIWRSYGQYYSGLLWSPYGIGQTIIFSSCRLFFFSSSFLFPRLISAVAEWMSAILVHLSLIHIWRCRRIERCRSRWSPYH